MRRNARGSEKEKAQKCNNWKRREYSLVMETVEGEVCSNGNQGRRRSE